LSNVVDLQFVRLFCGRT